MLGKIEQIQAGVCSGKMNFLRQSIISKFGPYLQVKPLRAPEHKLRNRMQMDAGKVDFRDNLNIEQLSI
jgi:hypothetical protein